MGKYHYKVYKTDNSEATVSHIKMLDESERVGEIANMLSGEVLTDAAMENARELLRTAAAD
jgi:DNA repair protein RecN (Recombination protein N)